MKKLLILFLVSSAILLDAQLLVVKINPQGYSEPLTDQIIQAHGKEIIEVFLKYTWPSCIAQDLTENEKKELFTPNKFGAEEIFVRRKLKDISPELDVVFIPTTLYEIFFIGLFFKRMNELSGAQKLVLEDFKKEKRNIVKMISILNQDLSLVQSKIKENKLIGKVSPAQYVKKEINDEYNKFNNKAFEKLLPGVPNFLVIHQRFIADTLSYFKSLHEKRSFKENDQSNFIKSQLQDNINHAIADKSLTLKIINFAKKAIEQIEKNKDLAEQYDQEDVAYFLELKDFGFKDVDFFQKIIAIEYKAFEENKGLLFRGSNPIGVKGFLDKTKKREIIGSTYQETTDLIDKNNVPFSLSFGNSLFAGIFFDWTACAYSYLLTSGGYLLYIDKLQYVDNYNSNLFFISALITEQALFGLGEWFHSRSKPVVKEKQDKEYSIRGLLGWHSGGPIKDTYGIFLITRSPYRQAYLFSKYLSKNGEVIGRPDALKLLQEEQKGIELLKKNQKEITTEYYIKNLLANWHDRYLNAKKNKKPINKNKNQKTNDHKKSDEFSKKSFDRKKEVANALNLGRAVMLKQNKGTKFVQKQQPLVQPANKNLVARALFLGRAIKIKNKK